MKFDSSHFKATASMVDQMIALLDEFAPELKAILQAEIKEGNKISEVSKGWPETNSIFVQTSRPFKKRYDEPKIEYKNLNDPHYWKEEYTTKNKRNLLVCPF
ncbi:hypothetical protein [Pelagicoccus mobilis]|uniref:Uncharacterized protein n=1 Tax=Pelagicoccus mobilis TaxID=415221 RepID=A0A934VKV4_9BACT|nr:hypothetical protein [Pelagicoccus mobilis]MBK1877086.1 hypothetical protein [Pelagicoccus mobilis]